MAPFSRCRKQCQGHSACDKTVVGDNGSLFLHKWWTPEVCHNCSSCTVGFRCWATFLSIPFKKVTDNEMYPFQTHLDLAGSSFTVQASELISQPEGLLQGSEVHAGHPCSVCSNLKPSVHSARWAQVWELWVCVLCVGYGLPAKIEASETNSQPN
jgi:hypothetical protein